jgi:hypothetical protein
MKRSFYFPFLVLLSGFLFFASCSFAQPAPPLAVAVIEEWTLPPQVDTKISVKYNRRGGEDGKERQRTAGLHPGI